MTETLTIEEIVEGMKEFVKQHPEIFPPNTTIELKED